MRRSAAPSVRAAKKMKFSPPYVAGNKADTARNSNCSATNLPEVVQQANPNQVSILFTSVFRRSLQDSFAQQLTLLVLSMAGLLKNIKLSKFTISCFFLI